MSFFYIKQAFYDIQFDSDKLMDFGMGEWGFLGNLLEFLKMEERNEE